jgi:hypothetical protein
MHVCALQPPTVPHVPLLQVAPGGHAWQSRPPKPHALIDCWLNETHVPFWQHPATHVCALQSGCAHTPLLHALLLPQASHAVPLAPHASVDWELNGTQPLPEQQPFEQFAALQGPPSHRPIWQLAPIAHCEQAWPLMPQVTEVSAWSGTQMSWMQQPGQLLGLHCAVLWHTPISQLASILHDAHV